MDAMMDVGVEMLYGALRLFNRCATCGLQKAAPRRMPASP